MELPTKRQQKRDFRAWQSELRESETFNGEEYIAPTFAQRFGRAFRYWFVSYEQRRGPDSERLPYSDPGHFRKLDDYLDIDDDERRHPL